MKNRDNSGMGLWHCRARCINCRRRHAEKNYCYDVDVYFIWVLFCYPPPPPTRKFNLILKEKKKGWLFNCKGKKNLCTWHAHFHSEGKKKADCLIVRAKNATRDTTPGHTEQCLDSYLCEWMWRQRHIGAW